ncbi:unnamed protein product [Clonostachys chloroleuca]|uniref:Uncharacterized protein n=1 Tax=Clonostachys chloroleuca TaxID=1926264 RepID=A0AA35LVG2_9HYPO|nr:unnamed protein product [Clonostachys chloroleuca]
MELTYKGLVLDVEAALIGLQILGRSGPTRKKMEFGLAAQKCIARDWKSGGPKSEPIIGETEALQPTTSLALSIIAHKNFPANLPTSDINN